MRDNSNLRLLDIIIFVLIIGIIATFAIPAYNKNMKNAKAYEAEITLEVLQKIMENYYQEYGHYPIIEDPVRLTSIHDIEINDEELTGKYYSSRDYVYVSNSTGQKFKIKAIGSKSEVRLLNREIDETGELCSTISF